MWRREERLGFWLKSSAASRKAGHAVQPWERLSCLFSFSRKKQIVFDAFLPTANEIHGVKNMDVTADVRDGLALLQGKPRRFKDAGASCSGACIHTVKDISFTLELGVQNLSFPEAFRPCIKGTNLDVEAKCRAYGLNMQKGGLRKIECLCNQGRKANDGRRFLWMNPPVAANLSKISRIPQMRTSVDAEKIKDSERQSFMREAEILKQIPMDRVEIIAIYRHVPIEIITRLRYIDRNRIILYSIQCEPRRTRTRVHDLAAVRDRLSGEMHLVPHRMRFRSIVLN